MYTIEFYLAIKEKQNHRFCRKFMKLENIVLSEVMQTDKLYLFSLFCLVILFLNFFRMKGKRNFFERHTYLQVYGSILSMQFGIILVCYFAFSNFTF